MKHEYSNQQIKTALAATTEAMGAFQIGAEVDGTIHHDPVYWADHEIQAVRTILHHLPEPASDEWQECRFEDIQKGDSVKRVRIYGSGTTDIREGVVANKDIHFASCTQKRILVSSEDLNSHIVKLYRIPAPVQHPDPDVHKYILDVDGDLWIWSKSRRKYIEPETLVQSAPAEIDEWTPAKVVEDDH